MSDDAGSLIARYRAAPRDASLAVLEGFHALKHALRFGAEVLDLRTRDPDAVRELARGLAPDILPALDETLAAVGGSVSTKTYDQLSRTPHPTGVIALATRSTTPIETVLGHAHPGRIVLLERPTNHGNIGAVVRVAAAAGAAAVLVTGPHDPWHPASIRGGAGLQFALPVGRLDERGVNAVVGSDRFVVALDPEGRALGDVSGGLAADAVLVFGSERAGVSPALLQRADLRVRIPMRPGVSSLNLATAAAIALYAAGGVPPSS